MDTYTLEILKIIVGSTGFLGIVAAITVLTFRTGKIVQKIEHLEEKIDKLEVKLESKIDKLEQSMNQKFNDVDERFKKIEDNLPIINIAITRLEVRLEERTLRVVDVSKKEISVGCNGFGDR